MSGHAEDPVIEESKRFFTFFNLSMILVAITGIEIVIIYVQTLEGSSIIGVLFATSILKFVGVIWWFMHLRWDKILNTVLFLIGLVIALATYFTLIYMADTHPEIENFSVSVLGNKWETGKPYAKGAFVLQEEVYYKANFNHKAPSSFNDKVDSGKGKEDAWTAVDGIPHQFSWEISHGDLIEINSLESDDLFFHQYHPSENEHIEGTKIALLKRPSKKDNFRIKVRSEAYLTVWPVPINPNYKTK